MAFSLWSHPQKKYDKFSLPACWLLTARYKAGQSTNVKKIEMGPKHNAFWDYATFKGFWGNSKLKNRALCCWHVIRKAIWRNLEVRNLKILCNISFWFLFKVQNWDSQEGRRQLLENKLILCNIRDF